MEIYLDDSTITDNNGPTNDLQIFHSGSVSSFSVQVTEAENSNMATAASETLENAFTVDYSLSEIDNGIEKLLAETRINFNNKLDASNTTNTYTSDSYNDDSYGVLDDNQFYEQNRKPIEKLFIQIGKYCFYYTNAK